MSNQDTAQAPFLTTAGIENEPAQLLVRWEWACTTPCTVSSQCQALGLRVFCSRNGVFPSRGVIFPGLAFFVPVVFFCSGRCFWCPGIWFFCPWNRFECYWNRFFGSPWYFRCPEGFFLCPTEMKCPRVFLVPVSFGNIDFVAWFNEKRFTKQRYGRCWIKEQL